MTAAARATRAGIVETTAMTTAIFLLAAGFPTEWVAVRARGELDSGGDLLVSVVFVALAGALGLLMTGRWKEVRTILFREPLLVAFLGWALCSVLWADNIPFSGRRAIAMLVTTYLGVHLVLRFQQFAVLRMLATVFAFVSFLNVAWILALPQFSGPSQGQTLDGGIGFDARLTGIYDNANSLGRVMALATFTMVAALRLDRRRRPLYLAGIGSAGLALALSQSKTSLVVSVLTSLLLIVFLVFRARKQLFGAVFISVIGSAIISVFLVVTNLGVVTQLLDRDITLSGRVPLWNNLFPRFAERPVGGHGFSGYWNGWGSPSHELWNLHSWLPPHGHNQFIDVTLTLGVIGVVLYSCLMVRTFVRATRYIRDIPGVFGLWPLVYCCFWLLIGMTEAGLIARDITWFLFVAAVVLVSTKKVEVDLRAQQELPDEQLSLAEL